MRRTLLALLGAAALAAAACRTPLPDPEPGHALCPCCAEDGDLACVDVAIGPDTPRAEIDGAVYWFCSEECRDRFVAEQRPARPR